jgi:choline-sulfatase
MSLQPKNLLIMMSDEQNRDMLGAYGHGLVKTPNIDALAARGTRFTSAYTNCPICVPSRAAFQSGTYPHVGRYWDNAIAYDGRVSGWGHRLQGAGIRVESIGKLHYRAEDDPLGFDEMRIPMYIKDGVGSLTGAIRDPMPPLATDANSKPGFAAKAGPGISTYNKYDAKVAELTCDWLGQTASNERDAPFVLFASFLAPHYPLTVPEEFFALYRPEDMPDIKLDPAEGYAQHPWVKVLSDRQPHANCLTPESSKIAVAAYFGLCSYVDYQIGLVLKALETTGLADSTRVIYTSDHGENAGARGLWGKSVMYEESAAIPMIMCGPDIAKGSVCKTPVSLIDFYPTVLQATGLEAIEAETDLPGKSLFEIASGPDDADRPVFSEYHASASPSGGYMVRKGRYKYSAYAGGYPPELFDLTADLGELTDLAADPAHAATIAEYDALLRTIVDPEKADRQAKDDQNAVIEKHGGREKVLADQLGAAGYTGVPEGIAQGL